MVRLVLVVLVSCLVACSGSAQIGAPGTPAQPVSATLADGSCNYDAPERVLIACLKAKLAEAGAAKPAPMATTSPETPPAATAAAPVGPPPLIPLVPVSTGSCLAPPSVLLMVKNQSSDEYLEVEQLTTGVQVWSCDREKLFRIGVIRPNGDNDIAYTIPPGATVRFVAVMATMQGGVNEARGGSKDVRYNSYVPMGPMPVRRTRHWQKTYGFPASGDYAGRGYLQRVDEVTMWPG